MSILVLGPMALRTAVAIRLCYLGTALGTRRARRRGATGECACPVFLVQLICFPWPDTDSLWRCDVFYFFLPGLDALWLVWLAVFCTAAVVEKRGRAGRPIVTGVTLSSRTTSAAQRRPRCTRRCSAACGGTLP